jgi:AGZA family xanthine/uracil permease-like MFS transporter
LLALLAQVDAGFVTRTPDAAHSTVPVRMGIGGHLVGWSIAIFCAGLLLMTVLISRAVPSAVLIGIIAATVLVVVNSVLRVHGWGLAEPWTCRSTSSPVPISAC